MLQQSTRVRARRARNYKDLIGKGDILREVRARERE
jgi:hypothetical protein